MNILSRKAWERLALGIGSQQGERVHAPSLGEKLELAPRWYLEKDEGASDSFQPCGSKCESGWMWCSCSEVGRERPIGRPQGKTHVEKQHLRNIGIPLLYPIDPIPDPQMLVTVAAPPGAWFWAPQDVLGGKLGLFLCDLGGIVRR